jgi:hypothetical protein
VAGATIAAEAAAGLFLALGFGRAGVEDANKEEEDDACGGGCGRVLDASWPFRTFGAAVEVAEDMEGGW